MRSEPLCRHVGQRAPGARQPAPLTHTAIRAPSSRCTPITRLPAPDHLCSTRPRRPTAKASLPLASLALRFAAHTIGKITLGQHRYYERQVAGGGDDYYSGRGEAPGEWRGAGAAALGLSGKVSAEQFGALIAGLDPRRSEEHTSEIQS